MRKKHGAVAVASAFIIAAAFTATGTPARAAEPLQTQMGVQGELEADVIKAKVDGDVLTVVVMFRNTTDKKVERTLKLYDAFFIDAAGKKKYMVLRDSANKAIAAPLNYTGKEINVRVEPGGKQLVWMKFPAPPAESATIDLTLPIALPFDDLKVQR